MRNSIDLAGVQRKRLVRLYTIGLLYPFLQSFLFSIGFPHSEYTMEVLRPFWLAVTSACVCGLFFQQPDAPRKVSVTMRLLMAAMGWMVLRIMLDRYLFYYNDPQHIWIRAFSAFFLYYPVGGLLTRQEMRKTVGCVAAFWVAAMVIMSLLGIVTAVGGFMLYTPSGATHLGMHSGRLALGYYCVLTAQNLVLACNVALFLMFAFKKWWVWVLCGISLAILFVAVGLTDGTNAMLTLGLLFGLAVFVLVTGRFSPGTWKSIAVGGVAAVLVMTVSYSLNTKVIGWVAKSPTRTVYVDDLLRSEQPASAERDDLRGILLSAAQIKPQEETAPETVEPSHREVDASMRGRTFIWKKVLKSLLTNENNSLLVGVTPFGVREMIQAPEVPYEVNVVHNMYLQVVLEWGIPGLVIMVTFLALFAMAAFRLLFGPGIPAWERFIPCMALAFLFSELADCFCTLEMVTVSLYLIFLFLGMTIGVDRQERATRK